jgi:endogenous inhibitor of DNA gyrase (YacG/DUF329 family)
MLQQPEPRKCAICGKPQKPEHRPFCSKRCADLDLARWLGDSYAIPAADQDSAVQSLAEDEG